MNETELPIKIGKYRILSVLGEGGMGVVYQAIDPNIEQQVALKVIRPEKLQQDPSGNVLQRFRNEVLACRRLKHDHIVSTFDYQEMDDFCFIVMELIEGTLLSEYLHQEVLFTPDRVVDIVGQLLSALQYAHDKGVIHRDIKPSNIIITEAGSVQVMDFGIAKLENSNVTVIGSFLGSPGYMSPEQCQEKTVDKRSDIFSVGVLLYQLLTGKKPFTGKTVAISIQKTLQEEPQKPTLLSNTIHPAFNKIIAKALAKDPKKRFQSAAEFKSCLESIPLDQLANGTTRDFICYRKPVLLSCAALSVVILLAAGSYLINQADTSHKTEETSAASIVSADQQQNITSTEDLNTIEQQVLSLLEPYQCNSIIVEQQNGRLNLSGSVHPDKLDEIQSKLQQLLRNIPFYADITPFSRPFCEVVQLITPFYKNNNDLGKLVKIAPYKHDFRYQAGEKIRMEIITPDYPVYLYADYFASDGTLIHLYPSSTTDNVLNDAHQRYILGEGQISFEVSAPFGVDLVILIASPVPVFNVLQADSLNAQDYLTLLSSALANLSSDKIIADYFFLSTGPAELVK